MIYEISGGGLKPVSSEGKNELPKGTILQLNGYDNPKYVIVKNQGIDMKYSHGARYISVNIDTKSISHHEAIHLKHISEKKNGGIQTYITEEPLMPDSDVDTLYQKALNNQARKDQAQKEGQERIQQAIEKGKILIDAKKPTWAKAVIVGYKEIDDCDSMTDYFNTQSGDPYLLAWSSHNRDIFSEMRKAAGNMEETKHLTAPPDIDRNGDKLTPENKSWWHPSDEHREKYSMGAGYYLKASHRYSTGWKVCKWDISKYRMESIYRASGEGRDRIPEIKNEAHVNGNGKILISENQEKGGIEIKFSEKPDPEIIDTLKSRGFRWSRFQSLWWAKNTPERLSFANSLT